MEETRGNILLTGFGPFQGRRVNGSQTLAEALHGKIIRDYVVQSRIFPVQWSGLKETLYAAMAETNPLLILGLGEGSKDYPCFENFARNEAEGIDETGEQPPSPTPVPGDLPVRRATMECERPWFQGLPVTPARSENPGHFLCNSLFYLSLSLHSGRAGFLHLPVQEPNNDSDYLSSLIPTLYRLINKNIGSILDE